MKIKNLSEFCSSELVARYEENKTHITAINAVQQPIFYKTCQGENEIIKTELRRRGLSPRGEWIGYGENSTTEVQPIC